MDFIRHDKFISWRAACFMAVAACFLQACKQPSNSDLTEVTGGSQTPATATITTTTTVPTPVVVNGPLGNSAFAFTPQSFDFGVLVANSGSALMSFTVTNISTYTLVLGAITGTNANFTLTENTCLNGAYMVPNAACNFTVKFAPALSGNLSAFLVIPYDVTAATNRFFSSLSVTGAGTTLASFPGLDYINNETPTTMQLNWPDVPGAATYQVYNVDSGAPVFLASVISGNLVPGIGCVAGSCSYTATGLSPSTFHAYRVLATDFWGVLKPNTKNVTSQTTADFLDFTGSASVTVGACTPLTVTLSQADHTTPEIVSVDTPIGIAGLGSGAIYSDNTCSVMIISPVVITAGSSSSVFYFKDNASESLTISGSRSQFSTTTKAVTVNPSSTIASVVYGAAPATAYTASSTTPMTTFTAAIKDAFGNVITTNSTATITLSRVAGSGTLGGTLTKTVINGVATFNDITDTKAETITLRATENASGSQLSVTSGSITVNPSPTIASVVYSVAPATAYTASSTTPMTMFTAAIKDSFGNVITTNSTATITLSRVAGSGTLGGTLTKTVSNGVATFNDITDTKAETITLKATENASGSQLSVTSGSITVGPSSAIAAISYAVAPATAYTASSTTPMTTFTAAIKDAFGNVITSNSTATITLSLVAGGSTLGGTLTKTVSNGVATFDDITYTKAETITLKATENASSNDYNVTSANITVDASSIIAAVGYVVAPAAAYTASSTAPMTTFTAGIKDAFGNVITANSTATITLSRVAGSGTLGGTLTKTVSNGVATFNDITYTKAETITLKATENASGSQFNVTSSNITVNPSPTIASVAYLAAPAANYTASNTTPMTTFTAEIKDAYGNVITTDNATTITASRASGIGALSGTVTRTVSSGVATFDDITYTTLETITIKATENASGSNFNVTSSSITVTSHLTFTQLSTSGDTDTLLANQPVVTVIDGFGATLTGAANSITLTAYSDALCTVPVAGAITATANPLAATSGAAAFSGVKILKTNIIRIGASATGLTSACSSALTIAAGAVNLAQSSVTWLPASLIANNSATSAITVTLKDANGNAIPGKTVTATSDRGTDTISGSGASTNSSGVVQLTVKSSSTGSSAITVVGNGSVLSPTAKVLFLSQTPLTDYQGRLFDGVNFGSNASSVRSVWKDLARVATTYDGSLFNFLFDATSGWSGTPPRSYSDEVLSDNPVGYWRLGETSGTTANDISGNAINGTYTNITLAQTGALAGDSDTAVSFNGTSSIVDLGNDPKLKGVFDSGKKWTVSMWFKTAHFNGNGPWLLSKAFTSHTSPYYQFSIRQGGDGSVGAAIWRGDTFTGQNVGVSSPAIPTGVWTHLAVTVDITNLSAVTIALYINGGTPLTSTADLPGGIYTNFDSPVTLGANKNLTPGSYNFDGLIDDVAIFPSALSAARILAQYNAGAHPDVPLVFNGSTSNSYVDFGTGVNSNTSFSFETWLKPANTAATGKVILSNGTTTNPGTVSETNTGLTLRQSKTSAGKLELFLGENGGKSYFNEVLSDSPMGYWRLGETSGPTAYDVSGNSHHGTYTSSGVTYGVSGALSGDTDTGITMNNTASVGVPINIATTVTVEAWGKNTDFSSTYRLLWRMGTGAWVSPYTVDLALYNGRIFLNQGDGEGNPFCNIPASATDGNFHHYVTVLNGSNSTAVLYYDGALCGSATYRDPTTSIFTISTGDNIYEWVGSVDEVAVYNTTLSPARILAHYNAGFTKNTCTSTSTFADNVWRFISGVFDSTSPTLKLFVDGTQECSITNAGSAYTGSANPLRLGRDNDNGTANSWAGQVADLRTYGSALTAANARDNMGATMGRFADIPPAISGLKLWLKADSLSGTDGSSVGAWSDSSGNGNNATQSTSGNQPLFKTNVLNGLPAVKFDGANDYMTVLTTGLPSNFTMFIVAKVLGNGWQHLVEPNGGGNTQIGFTGGGYTWAGYLSGPSISPPNTSLMEVQRNGSNGSLWINGASQTNGTVPTITGTQLSLGTYSVYAAELLNGYMPEILIYNAALSDSDRKRIEAYLNAKYGLY